MVLVCLVEVFGVFTMNVNAAGQDSRKVLNDTGIVLVAFGTSVPAARKVYDYILESAREKFGGYEILYGFTARSIVKKLRAQGMDKGVLTLEEAIGYLKKKGYKKIVLQSLHIVPGQKDHELKEVDVSGMARYLGEPLLSDEEDIAAVLGAIGGDIKTGMPNVVCGHGNDRYPEYNVKLIEFDAALSKKYPGAVLCSVEGVPGTGALLGVVKAEVEKAGGKVNFIPLMIVAGDHVMNDVTGSEDGSWKNIVGATEVSVAKSLGYNDAVLAIFWKHLAAALKEVGK